LLQEMQQLLLLRPVTTNNSTSLVVHLFVTIFTDLWKWAIKTVNDNDQQ